MIKRQASLSVFIDNKKMITDFNNINKPIFTRYEFKDINKESYLICYPSNDLIAEVKKANKRRRDQK